MKKILPMLMLTMASGAIYADDNKDGMYLWLPGEKDYAGYYDLREQPTIKFDGKNILIYNSNNLSGSVVFRGGIKLTFGTNMEDEPSGGIHEMIIDRDEVDAIFGDVNSDNNVKMSDANIIVNIVNGNRSIVSREMADIDGDGMVTMADAKLVAQVHLMQETDYTLFNQLVKNNLLQGSFNTYLRLVNDLGYTNILKAPNSVETRKNTYTLFPANDEAFERFFAGGKNVFGKSSYDALTIEEKKLLLLSSICLDKGALKAVSRENKSKTPYFYSQRVMASEDMPENNPYFAWYKNAKKSIRIADDYCVPMTVISKDNTMGTVDGKDSDWSILTGEEYKDGDVMINGVKVLYSDTRKAVGRRYQNGYIYQVENVSVNLKNIMQSIRENGRMKHLTRMLDYYAVPVYSHIDSLTNDSVFTVKYLSYNSGGKKFNSPQRGVVLRDDRILNFDPNVNYQSADNSIGTIFAPTDEAMEKYFATDGDFLLKAYGAEGVSTKAEDLHNTLDQHLDAMFNSNPAMVTSMLNLIMSNDIVPPSLFHKCSNAYLNETFMEKDDIARDSNGRYIVDWACNGVVYEMNRLYVPPYYTSTLGAVSCSDDNKVMAKMLNDHQTTPGIPSSLGADMFYYLCTKSNRYAVFAPKDGDSFYYIDPASKYDSDGMKALRFTWDETGKSSLNILVQRYLYEQTNNTYTVDNTVGPVAIEKGYYNTQLKDFMQSHVVPMEDNMVLSGNNNYKTMAGNFIYLPDVQKSITEMEECDNGTVYKITAPIQPATDNVYEVLSKNDKYKTFLAFCKGFNSEDVLYFAGILNDNMYYTTRESVLNDYVVFGENNNMNMLSSGDYTIYVPQDMVEAYNNGLPKWSTVHDLVNKYADYDDSSTEKIEAQSQVRNMVNKMRDFVRYHVRYNAQAMGSGDTMVRDAVTYGRSQFPQLVEKNMMAREVKVEKMTNGMDVNNKSFTYNKIISSVNVMIHGIDKPLCPNVKYGY